ncbi:Hypothetical Protein FCC1311_060152 [Hondaea fermentalgiana]|uniref:Uncharacterized protein n=1 Tax=Hondaea fermentalgiana TaxID=2315210 RepID=A0A2R5GGR6_9STRA|nr:Hypothetical Protein FCC1311_060152 [Hondaea fermentalgiana]|eukprot:GBG29795.1 Hypothetical Protein FCC1311_060152 [Hondaea fermentalgiana]
MSDSTMEDASWHDLAEQCRRGIENDLAEAMCEREQLRNQFASEIIKQFAAGLEPDLTLLREILARPDVLAASERTPSSIWTERSVAAEPFISPSDHAARSLGRKLTHAERCRLGAITAKRYREMRGESPVKRVIQLERNAYTSSDIDVLDDAIGELNLEVRTQASEYSE